MGESMILGHYTPQFIETPCLGNLLISSSGGILFGNDDQEQWAVTQVGNALHFKKVCVVIVSFQ